MVLRKYQQSGIISKCCETDICNVNVSAQPIKVVVEAGCSGDIEEYKDVYRVEVSSETYYYDYILDGFSINNFNNDFISYRISDSSIAYIDSDRKVKRINDGSVGIIACTPFVSKRVDVDVSLYEGQTSYYFKGFVESSVANSSHYIVSSLVNSREGDFSSVFSKTGDEYERNINCWLYGYPIECVSAWNSYSGNRRKATLITPRHVIMSAHYYIPSGYTIRFIDRNNNVIDRTVISTSSLTIPFQGFFSWLGRDITVGLLDSPIHDIDYAVLYSGDLRTYIPSLVIRDMPDETLAFPVCGFNQYNIARILGVYYYTYSITMVEMSKPNLDIYQNLFNRSVKGDSGNPVFLVIGNKLLLLTHCTVAGDDGTWGPNYSFLFSEINEVVQSLDSNYSLSSFLFNGYREFS